nr:EamA family transporter [Bacillus subtilis]
MKGNIYSLFVLMAAFFWGTTGTVQALAPESATPLAFGAFRLLIGGSAMLLAVWISLGASREKLVMAARIFSRCLYVVLPAAVFHSC